jgi:hypothetical protein
MGGTSGMQREIRNVYKILVQNPEVPKSLWVTCIAWRIYVNVS